MPKRRANGEGNIRKRKDGRWEVPDETFFEETGNHAGALLAIAASVEAKSEHPLAKAIMEIGRASCRERV